MSEILLSCNAQQVYFVGFPSFLKNGCSMKMVWLESLKIVILIVPTSLIVKIAQTKCME